MTDRSSFSDSSSSWSDESSRRNRRVRKVKIPTPNTKVMRAIKELFHGRHRATYQVIPEAAGCSVHAHIHHGALKDLLDIFVIANKAGASVGMCINEMDGQGRAKENLRQIKAVWVDIDEGFDPEVFRGLNPSAIVCTSEGRGHVFWLIKGDCDTETYVRLQEALARRFNGDPSVTDPNRAVRMPGTLHHKAGAVATKLVYLDKRHRRTSVKKLVSRLKLDINEQQVKVAAATVSSTAVVEVEAKVRSAIAFVPPTDDRHQWLKIGMAINAAMPNGIGESIWRKWSRKSHKFDEKDQLRAWKGFKKGGGRTVATLYKEAARHGWKEPEDAVDLGWEPTAFGVSDEFSRRADKRLCYDKSEKCWLAFGAHIWQRDEPAAVAVGRIILQEMIAEAEAKNPSHARDLRKRHASVRGVRALLAQATADAALNVEPSQFDAQPHLLAVMNGVVDLMTGQLRPGKPEDLLRRQAPVEYIAGAKAPKFLAFIEFITRGDREYAGFLQRAAGCSLFAHARDQVLFYLVGGGGNGKGVFIRRMEAVLGDHVVPMAPNLLTKAYIGNPQGPTPAFMSLQGARIAQCSEGQEGKKFDSAFIKQITGNDKLVGRHGYGAQAQFTPVCTPWLSSNALPDIDIEDDAMWRRVRILPFRAKAKRDDPTFEIKLDAEKSGILNWLIAGALAYEKHGLGTCKAVEDATRRAKRKGDSVQAWLDDRTRSKSSGALQATLAFQDYLAYCRKGGRHALSVHAFSRAVNKKGYRTKKTKRFNVYLGLKLNE